MRVVEGASNGFECEVAECRDDYEERDQPSMSRVQS